MADKSKVALTNNGFLLEGSLIPYFSGSFHYWRVKRSLWKPCLAQVKHLGLSIVDTYVPWSVHEIARGQYDFGQQCKENALSAFLEECLSQNLFVILRPGPHINAELTHFGIPERVLANPACQARTARNTPAICPAPPRFFPIPSYAEDVFYQEIGDWFSAFANIVRPFLGKPVIALQVDNEMSHFFRTGMFDLDYSVGSITLYREFLKTLYQGKERSMISAYGSEQGFDTIDPPRQFHATKTEDLPKYLDWAVFKRYYFLQALTRLKRLLEKNGLRGVPFFHNIPPSELGSPFSITEQENELDFTGLDLYHRRQEYALVKRRVLTLTGSSRFPTIPECGLGGWLAWQSFTPEDNLTTVLNALMHGVRGINFYMAVERERWYGAPISQHAGKQEPLFTWVSRLLATLKDTSFTTLSRDVPVLLLMPREYQDLAAVSSVIEPFSPMIFSALGMSAASLAREDTFGLRHVVQQKAPQIFSMWQTVCENENLFYSLAQGETSVEQLQKYPVLCVPTLDFFDETLSKRLLAYAKNGGCLVLGPSMPDLDGHLLPGAPFADIGADLSAQRGSGTFLANGLIHLLSYGEGKVCLLHQKTFETLELLEQAFQALLAYIRLKSSQIFSGAEFSCFRDQFGKAKVIFVASRKEETVARISTREFLSVYDPIKEESFLPKKEEIQIPMPPWTIKMLLVRETE